MSPRVWLAAVCLIALFAAVSVEARALRRSHRPLQIGPPSSKDNSLITPRSSSHSHSTHSHSYAAVAAAPLQFPSFVFPALYQSRVNGWVSDPFLNNHATELVAFYYADYTQSAYRADEIWNVTALNSTPFHAQTGVQDADHHLQVGSRSVFFWHNDTGAYCEPVAAGNTLIPAATFTSATGTGTVVIDGLVYLVYNATIASPPGYATLVTDLHAALPYSLFIYAEAMPGVVVQSWQQYVSFEEVEAWGTDSPLWTFPEFCPAAEDGRKVESA